MVVLQDVTGPKRTSGQLKLQQPQCSPSLRTFAAVEKRLKDILNFNEAVAINT
jgi:hypothetical protein